jgi:hypothetical protein
MKRFCDTAIWQDEWFMELPPQYKLAFMFIKDNCDNAGVWKPNKKLAEMMIGCPIDWNDFLVECGNRIKVIKSGYWWITRFIEFQYGTLSEACKPHIKVIESLKKYDLYKDYTKGMQYLEEKEEEEDKEEEKEGDAEKLKERKELFDVARKLYPGSKNGNDTEFKNFKKKNSDWRDVIPILEERIKNQIKVRERKVIEGAKFIPEWKNFSTWINKRCWEEETGAVKPLQQKKVFEPQKYA